MFLANKHYEMEKNNGSSSIVEVKWSFFCAFYTLFFLAQLFDKSECTAAMINCWPSLIFFFVQAFLRKYSQVLQVPCVPWAWNGMKFCMKGTLSASNCPRSPCISEILFECGLTPSDKGSRGSSLQIIIIKERHTGEGASLQERPHSPI